MAWPGDLWLSYAANEHSVPSVLHVPYRVVTHPSPAMSFVPSATPSIDLRP